MSFFSADYKVIWKNGKGNIYRKISIIKIDKQDMELALCVYQYRIEITKKDEKNFVINGKRVKYF
jgi:hypothetical protein